MDTGGTFTDIVVVDGPRTRIGKVPSTPDNPARAVLQGLRDLLELDRDVSLTYGSTVATNAVLERSGARVLLLTTEGFEDLIEIGRQTRPELYALEPERPPPLVSRDDRVGIRERAAFDGSILVPLSQRAVAAAVRRARRSGAEAVAICFLHSYAAPTHERRLAAALRRAGLSCTASHELGAQHREYERFSTAVINAYVSPKMKGHIAELSRGLRGAQVRVMQSNGGALSAATAAREAVRTILSGPAGGVVGAAAMARSAGYRRVITLDMGGTSTDVSLVDGEPRRHHQCAVGGLPMNVPAVDIHTVGAGGGSIASCDPGGVLKVGPESAGAQPGPACYGRGERATVTDANLVLGRLPSSLLGGGFPLDVDRARAALAHLGRQLGLDLETVASGVIRVVNAAMERAIRAVSVERGLDPRDYALLAFGGAAGLHACEMAESLGMTRVLIPRDPGVLSAWGAATADVLRDYMQTVRWEDPSVDRLDGVRRRLVERARRDLRAEGFSPACVRLTASLAGRYAGQSHEIDIPMGRGYAAAFHREHQRLYGHQDRQRPVEIVAVRVSARGLRGRRSLPAFRPEIATPTSAPLFAGRWLRALQVERRSLRTAASLRGPAVITELSATTYLPRGWTARADRRGHLHLRHGR